MLTGTQLVRIQFAYRYTQLVRIQFAYRYTAGKDIVCFKVLSWSGYSLRTGTQLIRI